MNCEQVRLLLTCAERKGDETNVSEREAVKQHLENCPSCARMAQAERRFDDVLGSALRNVEVPSGLENRVLARLAAQRVAGRWKRAAAVAAGIVLVASAWLAWSNLKPIDVLPSDVANLLGEVKGTETWDEAQVREFLKKNGLADAIPMQFDLAYLRDVEAIDFKGQRVARLKFSRADRFCAAAVLVLPKRFRTGNLEEDRTSLKIDVDDSQPVTYLIRFNGDLAALYRVPLNQQ